jgi:hypothetical protein
VVAAHPDHRGKLALAVLQQPRRRLDPGQRRLDVHHHAQGVGQEEPAGLGGTQVAANQIHAGRLHQSEINARDRRAVVGVRPGWAEQAARERGLMEDAFEEAGLPVQEEAAVSPLTGPEPEATECRVEVPPACHLDADAPGIQRR